MTTSELTIGRARIRFTDRHGGVSGPPYASANLGLQVGDDPAAVAENRDRLAASLGDEISAWVWLHQVHGDAVAVVGDSSGMPAAGMPAAGMPAAGMPAAGMPAAGMPAAGMPAAGMEADAVVTTVPGTAVCVQVADCAAIALVGGRAVGVVHAGWPGLEAGVISRAVDALRRHDPSPGSPVRAVLGPCIRPGRYEFGAADLARLVARFGPSVAATTDWGTPAFDIPVAVRIELARAGVDDLLDLDVCTSASPDHFSYRRDGVTGRQAVVAVLTP